MEIVRATKEEFGEVRDARPLSEESAAALSLKVDEVIRFKDHDHTLVKSANRCRIASRLTQLGQNTEMKFATRHDGPDLLVMRIK